MKTIVKKLQKNHDYERLIRFGLVGVANTATDVGLLYIGHKFFGLDIVIANTISTSAALLLSYNLHSNYTFKASSSRGMIWYVSITLFGLWVVQNAVLSIFHTFFHQVLPYQNDDIITLLAKALAIASSMSWNYLWYSRIIFKK
jgi:putative flippase GtrA